MKAHEIAAEILHKRYGYKGEPWQGHLHFKLHERLSRVSELAKIAGGEVHSRQVVAVVIEQFERDHPGYVAYNPE